MPAHGRLHRVSIRSSRRSAGLLSRCRPFELALLVPLMVTAFLLLPMACTSPAPTQIAGVFSKAEPPPTRALATPTVTNPAQTSTVSSATLQTASAATQDNTRQAVTPPDWKTYTSARFPVSIDYPPGWLYCEERDGVSFGPTQEPPCPRPAQTDAEPPIALHFTQDDTYARNFSPEFKQYFQDYEQQTINLNGRTATKTTGVEKLSNQHFALVVVSYQNSYVTLITLGDQYTPVLEQMYRTLRIGQ
jgi:hypothetical protein